MKKTFFTLITFIILLSSCSKKNTNEVKPEIKTNITSILQKYMHAWAEHDIPAIESFYADNVIWYDLPSDYTTKGKKQVGKSITDAFLSNVSDMYWIKSGDVFISKNTITYEWVYGGIYSGNWGDSVIKNKKFSVKGISTTTINTNGKITHQKDYYDLYNFQKQLGLIN